MKKIEIYQTDDNQTQIEVRFDNDSVWLSQAQITDLFLRDRTVITKHINNIFKEGELDEKSNVQKMHIANSDKPIMLYNLDVIISVGYRVKSQRGTQFRQWATKRLKDYFEKGFSVNQSRLIELQQTIQLISHTAVIETLRLQEAKGLLDIISSYNTQSFILLNQYDSHSYKESRQNLGTGP